MRIEQMAVFKNMALIVIAKGVQKSLGLERNYLMVEPSLRLIIMHHHIKTMH